MDQKEQYTQDLSNYMGHIDSQIAKINASISQHDCCILTDLNQLLKLVSETQNLAAGYFLQSYLAPYTTQYINLSLAAQHLSEKRHGALIAIERTIPIDDHINNGTPIGATISHVLLETIFYPGNPLHDGGVVIRKDGILSAGNIFPLTSKRIENAKIGTRHRAGIGLSEVTDAVVIMVSEETGRISFSVDGNFYVIRA